MYCIKCGTHLDGSQSFCTKCGTPVNNVSNEVESSRGVRAHECPSCGNGVGKDDTYCINCGASLVASEGVVGLRSAKLQSRCDTRSHASLWAVGALLGLACVLIAAAFLYYGQLDGFRNAISILHFAESDRSDSEAEEPGHMDGVSQTGNDHQENEASSSSDSNNRAVISISQVDSSSFPNNILYLSVQDVQGNNISDLKASECTVLEIVPSGGEVEAKVSGLQLVSQDGSTYKVSYVSSAQVETGYYLTVRFSIDTRSGVKGTAETTYALKTNSNTENVAPNQSNQENSAQATRDNSRTGDYILAESGSRYYSKTEIQALSDWELEIARNEIYARHGRGFNDKDLQKYFDSRSWYVKRYSAAEFDALPSPLNEYEKSNVALIGQVEASR